MSTPPAPYAAAPAPLQGGGNGRRLAAGYGGSWWSEGWRVFAAAPGTWIAIVLILFVIMFVLMMIPLVGTIAQTLLTPVFGGGVMLGCHALARGQPLRVSHLFDGFASGRFGPLMILGLVMLAAGFVLGLLVIGVMFAAVGPALFRVLSVINDPTQVDMSVLLSLGYGLFFGLIVGFIGFSLIAMAYWWAPALVVLNGEEPVAALRRSFAASWRNLGAVMIYGLLYILFAFLATIPLGLGWLVLAPVIAGSCYAGWRTIFS